MRNYLDQLEHLGLTANEAKIYVASLELGSATAQQIAAKAAVVRPTAYVAIGGLIKRGLISSFTKGKKQYFTAEKPDQLMRLVQEEKKKVLDQEEKLKSILPGLSSLISLAGEKPEVKYYEGMEGLEAMRKVLFDSGIKQFDGVLGSLSALVKTVPEEMRVMYNLQTKKAGISGRQINLEGSGDKLTTTNAILKDKLKFKHFKSKQKTKGEVSVFGEYASFIVYGDKPYGILIRSKDIATVLQTMFEIAWSK